MAFSYYFAMAVFELEIGNTLQTQVITYDCFDGQTNSLKKWWNDTEVNSKE